MPGLLPLIPVALVLVGCGDGPLDARSTAGPSTDDSLAALAADPPLLGTWWRLASLRGEDPVGGVRPVPIASGKLSVTPGRLVLYDENGAATTFAR